MGERARLLKKVDSHPEFRTNNTNKFGNKLLVLSYLASHDVTEPVVPTENIGICAFFANVVQRHRPLFKCTKLIVRALQYGVFLFRWICENSSHSSNCILYAYLTYFFPKKYDLMLTITAQSQVSAQVSWFITMHYANCLVIYNALLKNAMMRDTFLKRVLAAHFKLAIKIRKSSLIKCIKF